SRRAGEVGPFDPALEAEDEDHAPDHERRAEDQDAGLPQCLPEEVEDPAVEDVAEDLAGEADDVAETGDPVPRDVEPATLRRTGAKAARGHRLSPDWRPGIRTPEHL